MQPVFPSPSASLGIKFDHTTSQKNLGKQSINILDNLHSIQECPKEHNLPTKLTSARSNPQKNRPMILQN
jgi:hypothetical protein